MDCKVKMRCLCAECKHNDGRDCVMWQDRTCSGCSNKEANTVNECGYFKPKVL